MMYGNFANQNFLELKSRHLSSQKLFIDDKFQPNQATKQSFKWLRPSELSNDPQLYVDGFSRFDANQGEVGNCWFIAAMANLAQHPKLFQQVIPDNNGDFDDEYCGIFHFRFFHNGKWADVVIDDLLPTRRGELVFVRSTESNEFWPALLEKAYAKLHGGYDELDGGHCTDALSNFTGGVTEMYNLGNNHPNLYKMMFKSFNRHSLMDVGFLDQSRAGSTGLIGPHAYSVTKVVTIRTIGNKIVQLLRLRNPWGAVEWRGAWNDKHSLWNKVSEAEKSRINFRDKEDGEFYISFDDFIKYFDTLYICNLTADLIDRDPRKDREWKMERFDGSWNLHFREWHTFDLVDPDENDDEFFCTIVISLLHIQQNRNDEKIIGFNLRNSNGNIVKSVKPPYYMRENVYRYDLEPGKYKIETVSDYNNFQYMFRIFYEVKRVGLPLVKATPRPIYPNISMELGAINRQPIVCLVQPPAAVNHRLKNKKSKSNNCACSIC